MIMLLLFLTGLLAGTVDAIAGGGGLISMPVLMSVGLPPHIAFGTNKLQSSIGTLMAARRYYRAGWVSMRDIYMGLIFGLLGAASGTMINQIMSGEILKKIVPVMLAVIFLYTLLSPRLGLKDREPRIKSWLFYLVFGFALGFYDGFFGPGVGAFWVFLLTFFLGYNLIKATAYTKVLNLNTNLVSLICFAAGMNINYEIGLCMAAGQIIGGQLGASLAINKGARLIRPIFLSMVFVTIASLAYRSYGSSIARMFVFDDFVRIYLPVLIAVLLVGAILLIRRLQQTSQQAMESASD